MQAFPEFWVSGDGLRFGRVSSGGGAVEGKFFGDGLAGGGAGEDALLQRFDVRELGQLDRRRLQPVGDHGEIDIGDREGGR